MTLHARLSATPLRISEGESFRLLVTLTDDTGADVDYTQHTYVFTARDEAGHDNKRLNHALKSNATTDPNEIVVEFFPSVPHGNYTINVSVWPRLSSASGVPTATDQLQIHVAPPVTQGQTNVTLQRTWAARTNDIAMGPAIRNRTAAVGYDRYAAFIDCVFGCNDPAGPPAQLGQMLAQNSGKKIPCLDIGVEPQLNIHGPYAYTVLKLATQAFLTLESGVVIRDNSSGKPHIFDIDKERARFGDPSLTVEELTGRLEAYLVPTSRGATLPYLDRIVKAIIGLDQHAARETLPYCHGVLAHRVTSPSLIELIWSYWHEEGMLVQTMNAIARRFQNQRSSHSVDPLGELEFDPLRPLNNLIWGFIQDEHNRLTVPRRAYEYQHHYGMTLVGKAISDMRPADVRSKFIEAFHNLLYRAAVFYREDSDTTVIADAFPLLNALKEVHLLLAEGAHNQFGDLTWTARAEMLMTQWMLARPEMREFLRGRYMVPYQEPWMGAVDSMKKLQGWTDTSVTHFHELAVTGERVLLSIRYGDWVDIENIEDQAKNWARSWKPEIQRYLHGYMTVSGVDLMADVADSRDAGARYLQPSALLQSRLTQQRGTTARPTPAGPAAPAAIGRGARLAALAPPAARAVRATDRSGAE